MGQNYTYTDAFNELQTIVREIENGTTTLMSSREKSEGFRPHSSLQSQVNSDGGRSKQFITADNPDSGNG